MNSTLEKSYLFISNSVKPTIQEYESIEPIIIGNFESSSLYAARELGYKLFMGVSKAFPDEIRCATHGYNITYYNEHIFRNIFAFKDNWIAYKNTCTLLDKHPEIRVIHCNTPIGGVIGRLAGCKFNKKVIYMVHGFHFYKGAPLINWLLFYPIEKFLLRYTDVLITINSEDYSRAKNYKLRNNGNIYYVPGVGIDLSKLKNTPSVREQKRQELQLPSDAVVVIAVGRLDKNKNNALTIDAFSKMNNKNAYLIICGEGNQRQSLEEQISGLGLSGRVHLLGNRNDVLDLYRASDVFVLSSFREGLSRSIMEAMGVGLPCIVTRIRGNIDLIEEGQGGYCVAPTDSTTFAKYLDILSENVEMRNRFSQYNLNKIQIFSDVEVKKKMFEIFKQELS